MKKIIALLLVLVTVASMFVACGNGDKETTTADNGTTTTTTNNEGTTTTVADETTTSSDVADETTTSGEAGETTTSGDESLPTTDPAGETTTTASNSETTTTVSETTTTVSETTTTQPQGTTEIFKSAWGAWDTKDIITGERVTASILRDNTVTVTYTTTVSCSICKSWMKSYMNQLMTELRKRGGDVCVILIFAGDHFTTQYEENQAVYRDWYKANGGQFPFIVADSILVDKVPSGVPNVDIWVGGSQGGAHKVNFYGGTGGKKGQEMYDQVWNTCQFWLKQIGA